MRVKRRNRFREWLCVGLQTLGIFCVVLAAAVPASSVFLPGQTDEALNSSSEAGFRSKYGSDGAFRLFIIDDSASMGASLETNSIFASHFSRLEAALRAGRCLKSAQERQPGNASVRVLPVRLSSLDPASLAPQTNSSSDFGSDFRSAFGFEVRSQSAFPSLFPQNASVEWEQTLEDVRIQLGNSARNCTEVVVFSDFTDSPAKLAAFLESVAKLTPNAAHRLLSSFAPASSLALANLEAVSSPVLAKQPVSMRLTVRNDSDVSSPSVCVELTLLAMEPSAGSPSGALSPAERSALGNSRPYHRVKTFQKWVAPTARQETQVEFPIEFPAAGEYVLEAALKPSSFQDQFPEDDVFHLALNVKDSARFLIVEAWDPKFAPGRTAGAFYLKAALEGIFSGRFPNTEKPILSVECQQDSDLGGQDLTGVDALILCGIPRFTPEEAERISAYVRGGGAVWAFPGAQTSEQTFQPLASVLPGTAAEKERSVPDGTVLHPDLPPERFPLIEIFRQNPDSGLRNVSVSKWVPIQPAADAQTVLRLTNGAPLWLVREVRDGASRPGRTVLSAISADTAGSTFPLLPVWLPLADQTIHFLTSAASPLPTGFSANCPTQESARLNERCPMTSFPADWEFQEAATLSEISEPAPTSLPVTLLFLTAAAAWLGAGFCVPRHP